MNWKYLDKVYQRIFVTSEVAKEFGEELPSWITTKVVKDKKYQLFLETQVDSGEASVIALAVENDNSLLLLDDLRARKLAQQLGLKFTGILGVINKAKSTGFINKVKPIINKLLRTNFRISQNIISELLKLNGEDQQAKE